MTIKEMDRFIQEYCDSLGNECTHCIVKHLCDPICGCFDKHEDICCEACEIIMHFQKTQHEHDGCKGCKHELKEDDELPCSHCRYTLLASNPLYKICPDCYETEVPENPYWERINAIAEKQRAKGINKYGVGLESNPAAIFERINHLQEELIDGLYYLEWIKDGLNEKK